MKVLFIFALTLATVFSSEAHDGEQTAIDEECIAEEDFAYLAGILHYTRNSPTLCAGVLISHTEVLTPAHCVHKANRIRVVLGVSEEKPAEVFYEVDSTKFIIHPDFKPESLQNDIAIVRVPYTNFSRTISPVKMPASDDNPQHFLHTNLIASSLNLEYDTLHVFQTNMTVIPANECQTSYGLSVEGTCILVEDGRCRDSEVRGPLVTQDNILLAICMYALDGGCQRNLPEVFVPISPFLYWINCYRAVV